MWHVLQIGWHLCLFVCPGPYVWRMAMWQAILISYAPAGAGCCRAVGCPLCIFLGAPGWGWGLKARCHPEMHIHSITWLCLCNEFPTEVSPIGCVYSLTAAVLIGSFCTPLVLKLKYSRITFEHHKCWRSGDARSHVIKSNGIDSVLKYSGLSTSEVNS